MTAPHHRSADTARPGSDEQDAPASPAPPQGEREAFEAWARAHDPDWRLIRSERWSTYEGTHATAAWDAWQARASLRASPAVPVAQDERELRNLYSITGDIKDINTVLVNRAEYRAALSASTQPAVSAEAQHGTREDAYDQIDRFLRNNMDDESYAHYSQALDLVWGTPPADNKENGNGQPV